MIDKLPYTLTEGVVATREGLHLNDRWDLSAVIGAPFDNPDEDTAVYAWWLIAERLRYRDGEPWCHSDPGDTWLYCGAAEDTDINFRTDPVLKRLAAILCDDAEGFRVLHWCVHNLCNGGDV